MRKLFTVEEAVDLITAESNEEEDGLRTYKMLPDERRDLISETKDVIEDTIQTPSESRNVTGMIEVARADEDDALWIDRLYDDERGKSWWSLQFSRCYFLC